MSRLASEQQWLVVVGAYLDEEINLGKAAELLDMHALELQEKFLTQGISIRHGVDTLEEAHVEMAAILRIVAIKAQMGYGQRQTPSIR